MKKEVIRDGEHPLNNLTKEEFRSLPGSIHGICACGHGGALYLRRSPFASNYKAWYLCTGCHHDMNCWYHATDDLFEAGLSVEGAHHKQWYLARLAMEVGFDLSEIEDRGIAP